MTFELTDLTRLSHMAQTTMITITCHKINYLRPLDKLQSLDSLYLD